jgi:hypothetical protein
MATTINASTSAGLVSTADTSGVLQLQTAGTTALTVNTTGAIGVGTSPSYGTSGQVLTSGGTSAAPTWTTVSASPAGSTTQFQYNNAGAFAGASNLTYAANGPVVTSLGVGSTTPSASGAGIAFPATQSASSDVNTLDDYEEGSWTPSLGGTATYNFTNSTYTKIGRQVTVVCYLDVSVIGTGSTSVISGLPFSSTTFGDSAGAVCRLGASATNVTSLQFRISGTTCTSVGMTAAGSMATQAVFGNNSAVMFTATYFTST